MDKSNNSTILYTIPKNTCLYRSIKTLYENPYDCLKPMFCKDTNKTGCYFAVESSVLSDFMTLEYNSNLYLYSFILKSELTTICGKYTNDENIKSHFETDINPLSFAYDLERINKDLPSYELFISDDDLKKVDIEFIEVKEISVLSIKNKYKEYHYKNIDFIINSIINTYNRNYDIYITEKIPTIIDGNKCLRLKYKMKEFKRDDNFIYIDYEVVYKCVSDGKISIKIEHIRYDI